MVGFWTPGYLQAKVETLRAFRQRPIVLAVAERVQDQLPGLPKMDGDQPIIVYKTRLKVEQVLERLQATGPAGDPDPRTAGQPSP